MKWLYCFLFKDYVFKISKDKSYLLSKFILRVFCTNHCQGSNANENIKTANLIKSFSAYTKHKLRFNFDLPSSMGSNCDLENKQCTIGIKSKQSLLMKDGE